MLNPVAAEDLYGTIISVDRQSHRHRPLGKLDPAPFRVRYLQMVSNQVKLLTGHAESGMIVNLHPGRISAEAGNFQRAETGPQRFQTRVAGAPSSHRPLRHSCSFASIRG